ncbi:hypothetical protein [Membranihabitans marinus]|uniref:hypothetical protein n=1 Tax=Membranihabitans marinus TaxID=1227546 RepID=UPI001F2321A5|nr:hypothetical protein [Membranihabitans marinus]
MKKIVGGVLLVIICFIVLKGLNRLLNIETSHSKDLLLSVFIVVWNEIVFVKLKVFKTEKK